MIPFLSNLLFIVCGTLFTALAVLWLITLVILIISSFCRRGTGPLGFLGGVAMFWIGFAVYATWGEAFHNWLNSLRP